MGSGWKHHNEAHSCIRVKNEITVVSEAWDYKDRLY